MNHLQELRLFEAPGPGATKGGDLTPLFAALLNYAEKTPDPLMNKSLTTLHCSVIMRKPNIPFIQFLRLQPQIEELHGADVLHNAPIQLPEDVLPNLKKYHAPSVRAALAWLRGRAVKLLVIPRIDSSNHVEILMDALTCSNAPVEELTVQDNAWGRITYREPQNNLLSRLAQISYPVVRLRIPAEYANMDASGDGEDVRLARLPKLQLFERI
ncbi:hypothetical protein DL93DRAFT_2075329 [Clavulina sp. PMI_390]|nr:hypothetical protein DL93DRAFT_2075329 [Clavulina sp. PMI_390]